ncbi:hypothetical protein ACRBEV_05170 [Methylobacterium phyllosphaerae]
MSPKWMMTLQQRDYSFPRLISMEAQMSDQVCIDLYREEARNIIARTEEIVQKMGQKRACEGHKLMAAQYILALKRLSQMIERHQRAVSVKVAPNAQAQPIKIRRRWRLMPQWYPKHRLPTEGRAL